MLLELGDYKITTDSLQYIVKRKNGTVQDKNSKNYGKGTEVTVGYYSNLQSALCDIPQNIVRNNSDINSILTKIENIERIAEQMKVIKVNEVAEDEVVIKKEDYKKLKDSYDKELAEMLENELTKEEIEIGKAICEIIGNSDIENSDTDLTVNGVKYAIKEIEEWNWSDEGKYSYGECVCQLGIADKENTWNIAEGKEMNVYIKQTATRCGSYFTDYDYVYDTPSLVKKKKVEKEIWV